MRKSLARNWCPKRRTERCINKHISAISLNHADIIAAERAFWVTNAEILYMYCHQLKSHNKDFVPHMVDDEWMNTDTSWPAVGTYCDGKKFDPFGLKQENLSENTVNARNNSIRSLYKQTRTTAPFYTAACSSNRPPAP